MTNVKNAYTFLMSRTPELRAYILDLLTPVDERELEIRYCQMLDDVHGSGVLATLDPVAYRCGFADYKNADDHTEIEGSYYLTSDLEDVLEGYGYDEDEGATTT